MTQDRTPSPAPHVAPRDAEAFLDGAALSLGSNHGGRRHLHERIATQLQASLPDALVLVASFEAESGTLYHEAAAGPAGSAETLADLGDEGDEGVPCPAGVQARLLEGRLHRSAGADAWDAPARYELGLVYEGVLLGALTVVPPRPLSPGEQRLFEALAQHAAIAMARQAVESVDETALLVGLDGRVQACSRQTVERLIHSAEDPAWPAGREIEIDSSDLRRERSKALLEQGRAVRYTERIGGRLRDCSLHPVLDHAGGIHAFAGFARDVTEQVRLQQRVRRAATFQRALFSSLSEGVLVLDDDGVITDCNRAVQHALGAANRELVGRPVAALCAKRASWNEWEQELLPQLEPGGDPVEFELRLRRPDGSSFTARIGATAIELSGSEGSVVWTVRDVTDELLRFEQLEHLATHDALTGLPNRLLFQDRYERARQAGQRYGNSFAVLMIDLDGFKAVNDTLGHEMGDLLLATLGERLQGSLRAADTVSRLGGDEFAVLLPTSISTDHALQVGHKLLGIIEEPVQIDGHTLRVSASVGVARFPDHHSPELDLLARADETMYAAKRAGGHRVSLPDNAPEG